jgi:hypothetical protein
MFRAAGANLRFSLIVGAIIGAIAGVLVTSVSTASAPQGRQTGAASQECRGVCESVTWLRRPVRVRLGRLD